MFLAAEASAFYKRQAEEGCAFETAAVRAAGDAPQAEAWGLCDCGPGVNDRGKIPYTTENHIGMLFQRSKYIIQRNRLISALIQNMGDQ